MMKRELKLGIVGAGNMAQAIAGGVLRAKACNATQIQAADPLQAQREAFEQNCGVSAKADNSEVVKWASVVLLAIKPQVADEVFDSIRGALHPDALVVSIMAGIPTKRIEGALGANIRVVRTMPNTPALVGAAMSAIAPGANATQADLDFVCELLASVGSTLIVDEAQLDAVTAVSGSGPAYVFAMIEGLRDAGIAEGLSAEHALTLATQTVFGAAKLLLEADEAPEILRARVTSPGGTTQAGLAALQKTGFAEALRAAVHAATNRSKELA